MRAATIVLGVALLTSGCDKLKGALSKDDAGASGSGGILSFLGTDFEGEITANVTSKARPEHGPMQLVFGIKKPKYRIDTTEGLGTGTTRKKGETNAPAPPPGGAAVLIDPHAEKGWILSPPEKMAMVVDFAKLKAMPKGQIPGVPAPTKSLPNAPPSQPPKIDKTSKKDVVAGYSCDIWNITSEGKKVEACVAEGITWFDLGSLPVGSPELGLAALATEANRFPLRVISFDAKGAEDTRMECVKVDKKKLDDGRFVVPPDYRIVDLSGLDTRGLGNLPKMPALPKH